MAQALRFRPALDARRPPVAAGPLPVAAGPLPLAPCRPALGVGRPAPNLQHIWGALALMAAVLGSALFPIESIDYWWTVKLGDLIRRDGALLTSEPLMYTPVRDVAVDGQWLARVIISWLHEVGGLELSLALRTSVALGVAALLLQLCRDAGAGIRTSSAIVCLASILYLPSLAVRPQLLAVVPFLIVLRATLVPPSSLVGVLGVAAVVAVWANVHGSFVLVYPLLAIGVFDALRRALGALLRTGEPTSVAQPSAHLTSIGSSSDARVRLFWMLGLAAACACAPLANLYGPGLATYVWDTIVYNGGGTEVGTLAAEWGPPTLKDGYGRALIASMLGAVLLAGSGRRPRFAEGLLLLLFGLLALSAVRHVLWWGLVATPYVARALGEVLVETGPRLMHLTTRPRARAVDSAAPPGAAGTVDPLARPLGTPAALGMIGRTPAVGVPALNWLILALFGLVAVASLPWYRTRLPMWADRTALVEPNTPIAVAEYLARRPGPGELFHSADWGGYFGWRLAPGRKLFIDDRFEVHPARVWKDYMTLSAGHASWEGLAAQYGIGQLALDREAQGGLVKAVAASPNWTLTYANPRAVVYERRADADAAAAQPAADRPKLADELRGDR